MFTAPERQAQRAHLIETATKILEREGPQGLSLRHIAQEAQTSTQMIYTLFGGKDGLVFALYEEGFLRLEGCLDQVPYQDDTKAYLRAFLIAYRSFAHQEPLFYEIMFGRLLPQFEPPMADSMRRRPAYSLLLQIVTMLIHAPKKPAQPRIIADALWMSVHGALRMELQGFYDDDEQAQLRFELTVDALLEGLLSDQGRARAASHQPEALPEDFFHSI